MSCKNLLAVENLNIQQKDFQQGEFYLWLAQLICETPSGVEEFWDCKAQRGDRSAGADVVVAGAGWPMALGLHEGWGRAVTCKCRAMPLA